MVVSLFLLLYGLTLSFVIGNSVWAIILKWFKTVRPTHIHPALFPILGMAAMSPFIGLYHFFFKIDIYLHLFFLAWIAGNFRVSFQLIKQGFSAIAENWMVYLILLIGALLSIISRPGEGDIADYHLQAIKWAENYPNIIGLGNFNRPLANNNWWFNLQAFFGFSFLGVDSVYVGNAIYFICLFSWLFFSETVSKGHQWMRFLYASFIILSLKTAFVGAVTSDIIVTGMIYLLIDLFIVGSSRINHRIEYLLLMVLLSSWIVTVKTTAIVFFMIPLLWIWQLIIGKQWISLGKMVLLGSVFVLPWIAGNVMICGYLLYPFNQIDLFSFDWKVPAYFFEFDKIVLSNWGKVPGQDIFVTQKMSFSEWMPIWFSKLDVLNKLLVLGYVISIPILSFTFYRKKEIAWPLLFVVLGFTIIFINGPHPRFLFGYMLSGIAILAYVFADRIKLELPFKFIPILGLILCLFLFYKSWTTQDLVKGWFSPKSYPSEQLEKRNMEGFEVFITHKANTCWDKFPSSYYFIDSVELRGNRVEEGFWVRP